MMAERVIITKASKRVENEDEEDEEKKKWLAVLIGFLESCLGTQKMTTSSWESLFGNLGLSLSVSKILGSFLLCDYNMHVHGIGLEL